MFLMEISSFIQPIISHKSVNYHIQKEAELRDYSSYHANKAMNELGRGFLQLRCQ